MALHHRERRFNHHPIASVSCFKLVLVKMAHEISGRGVCVCVGSGPKVFPLFGVIR